MNLKPRRDIRPQNIFIDIGGNIKIIDFGFGKKLNNTGDAAGSIFLNWPVSEHPLEIVNDHMYTQQSEVYFVGKLFSHLDLDSPFASFRFHHIIRKMAEIDPSRRYETFTEIIDDIYKEEFITIGFSDADKNTYQTFATNLTWIIAEFTAPLKIERDINKILQNLYSILSVNVLDDEVQNSNVILTTFINNNHTYYSDRKMPISILKDFYQFLRRVSYRKQQLIIDNLHTKLSTIKVKSKSAIDDVPF